MARGSCKDGGGCQGWTLWWDEPDRRAGELQGRQVGWEESVDVVCGADRFFSQLETLKNTIDPEQKPGDEQDNVGDSTCIA